MPSTIMSVRWCLLLLPLFCLPTVESNPPNRYGDTVRGYGDNSNYNDPLKSNQVCQRPLDPIVAAPQCYYGPGDNCQVYYSNSICDYSEARCKCRCNYRWDYNSKQCLVDQDYNDNCWFCTSSRRNVTLPLLIILLVLVIIIAVFAIPTCVAVTCFKSKS